MCIVATNGGGLPDRLGDSISPPTGRRWAAGRWPTLRRRAPMQRPRADRASHLRVRQGFDPLQRPCERHRHQAAGRAAGGDPTAALCAATNALSQLHPAPQTSYSTVPAGDDARPATRSRSRALRTVVTSRPRRGTDSMLDWASARPSGAKSDGRPPRSPRPRRRRPRSAVSAVGGRRVVPGQGPARRPRGRPARSDPVRRCRTGLPSTSPPSASRLSPPARP